MDELMDEHKSGKGKGGGKGMRLPPGVQEEQERLKGSRSPLHVAVQDQDIDAAWQLVHSGADVNAVDMQGVMPLHFAAMECTQQETFKAIFQILSKMTCELNGKTTEALAYGGVGDTPLHLAAERCNLSAVKCLVAAGANVCAQREDGKTPLHVMASSLTDYPTEELTMVLAGSPEARSIKDNDGRTALGIFTEKLEYICQMFDPQGDRKFRGASARVREYQGLREAIEVLTAAP